MKKMVMIVDDDFHVRKAIYLCLKTEFETMLAGGLGEFIRNFKGAAKKPDVVITDLKMEDGCGTQIKNWLLENNFKIPVILISGSLDLIPDHEQCGFAACLEKPFDEDAIFGAIDKALQNKNK